MFNPAEHVMKFGRGATEVQQSHERWPAGLEIQTFDTKLQL